MTSFRPHFGLNIEYGRCPSVDGGQKGAQPLTTHSIYQWPHPSNLVGSWHISLTIKPNIVGVDGANLQRGRIDCPSCCQRERTLHWNHRVAVSNLLKVVLHVGKGAKFEVQKVKSGQDMCSGATSVGNGKNSKKTCSVLIQWNCRLSCHCYFFECRASMNDN